MRTGRRAPRRGARDGRRRGSVPIGVTTRRKRGSLHDDHNDPTSARRRYPRYVVCRARTVARDGGPTRAHAHARHVASPSVAPPRIEVAPRRRPGPGHGPRRAPSRAAHRRPHPRQLGAPPAATAAAPGPPRHARRRPGVAGPAGARRGVEPADRAPPSSTSNGPGSRWPSSPPTSSRVSWGPGPAPVPYAIAGDFSGPAPEVQAHPIDVLRADGAWVLRSDALEVTVLPDGSLRTARPDGTLLRTESAPARRGAAWEQSFSMRAGERMCGLGEQASGIDRRGATVTLWNTDPGGSWGPGRARSTSASRSWSSTHPDGDVLTFYENSTRAIVPSWAAPGGSGPRGRRRPRSASPAACCAAISWPGPCRTSWTATPSSPGAPPCRRAGRSGYHQSRWGYRSEADVRAITDGFAQLGLPLSAVHLDIDYMRGFRVFTVDPDRFPDLGAPGRRGGRHRGAPGDHRRPRGEGRPRLRRVLRGPGPAPVLHRRARTPRPRASSGRGAAPSPTSPTPAPGRGGRGSTARSPTPVWPASGTT